MKIEQYTTGQVCKILNIPQYKLDYLFKARKIDEEKFGIKRISPGQRVYTEKSIRMIKELLNN